MSGDDNVVEFDFVSASVKRRSYGTDHCRHRSILVDECTHTVECAVCHKLVDPYCILLGYAREARALRNYEEELRRTQKRLGDLKEEEKKVKSRLRYARKLQQKGHTDESDDNRIE